MEELVLNKEQTLTINENIVTLSTRKKFRFKEYLKTAIPQFVVMTIVFSLAGDIIQGLVFSLGFTILFSIIYILFRVLTAQVYYEFVFDVEQKIAFRKFYRFNKLHKEKNLIWNDEQLYVRDVSRSGWRSCILTYRPDLDKEDIESLVVIKPHDAIELFLNHVPLSHREKRNKHAFFDN